MWNFVISRRRRSLFYKAFGVLIAVSCIVLWSRKGTLRSDSSGRSAFRDSLGEDSVDNVNERERLVERAVHSAAAVVPAVNIPQIDVMRPPRLGRAEEVVDESKMDHRDDYEVDDRRNAYGAESQITPERLDREIDQDLQKIVPGLGDGGEPVTLSGAEQKIAEEKMKKEAFNIVLSDKISPNRTIPDARSKKCLSNRYDETLPSASIIIIFTNEAFSPLVRTIHSVINRTPARLLREVILVDDFSDRVELGAKLDRYIQRFFNHQPSRPDLVRLIRLSARSGLIRARLAGARAASGDVLVFLDSHCECGLQWMEPLLQRIKEDRTAVLTPIIDVIDDKTLQYYNSNGEFFQVGGFTWSGHFTWIDVPEWEQQRRGSPVAPTRSPTMAGGLFAIDASYFWESGSYDEGMDVWGGENLEMSFRIWMCGGKIETIPCSRVGHIFRDFHPYTFPGNKDTHGINTARLAEVWMDDYRRLFYLNRPDLQTVDIGSISDRLEFRRKKHCKSFKWYLENVLPQKFIPDENVQGYGRVVSNRTQPLLCLDMMQHNEDTVYNLGVYACHNFMAASQMFSLSKRGELRREEVCASVRSRPSVHTQNVIMSRCNPRSRDQTWTYQPGGYLVHKSTGLCLDRTSLLSGDDVLAAPCDSSLGQVWYFDSTLATVIS